MPLFRLTPERITSTPAASFFDEGMCAVATDALRYFGVLAGTPIALNEQFELDLIVTDFAVETRRSRRSQLTAETYARELEVFCRYLRQVQACSFLASRPEDFWAYRHHRLEGPAHQRVAASTWNKIAAALIAARDFYRLEGQIGWREFKASRSLGDHVRMIGLREFTIFRDFGMATAPRAPQRNIAFAELLVTTGMRCSEAGALLRHEVPSPEDFGEHNMVELQLPAAITKGEKSRYIRVSRRVCSGPIRNYREEERAHVAQRLIASLFGSRDYRTSTLHRDGGWLFYELVDREKIRIVAGPQQGAVIPMRRLRADERRRLVTVRPAARIGRFEIIDFGALWLSEHQPLMSRAGWGAAFADASKRAGGKSKLGRQVTPHVLRHTFAVRQLNYMLQGLIEIRQQRGRLTRRGDIYDRVVGDPLRTLQSLLGHASYASTRRYLTYMEDNEELVRRATAEWDAALG